ncbi:MAG: serine/threonine-protein kinase [Chloroflexi bacterium]|nr:serine/threonine-protein kinase [Chloroflexota bacterium]
MTLEKNTIIHDRYRIVEILGQGGMGSVYRAIDERLGVAVALKENLFTTEEYMRQFRLEAVILANLRHPNLPRVSDHFELSDQGQYLVMDFIEGEDLRNRMDRLGTITEEDATQIGAAMCDALAYLHSRKPPILHRDIKPGNVKITPDGHIFLVDFGLAKVYQGTNQATTTGARAMTPGYSPPEQYGTARTDPRTDFYSLGATLYAALSGVIPEDGLARAMDNAQLTPLRKRNSKVSRRLASTIEKAMAIDPSDRFQTAEEFKKALLGSGSPTAQLPGNHIVAPPPPEIFLPVDPEEVVAAKEKTPPRQPVVSPITPPAAGEELPFVSPLKRQKERERRRRAAVMRFFLILILAAVAALAGVFFYAPGILPVNLRNAISVLIPTRIALPFYTQPPLPTQTLTPTATSTPEPPTPTATAVPTNTPTNTPLPTPTATVATEVAPTENVSTPEPSEPVVPGSATPIGNSGQVAYSSNRTGLPQIYLFDLATQEFLKITDMPEGACQPAWSPDGQRLVFISPCRGMDEIYYGASLYIINADGNNLTPIVSVPGGDFDPAWSPDGSSIAFTSLRTGQMEIFVMNVDDPAFITQITKGAKDVEARQPAWSPDGSQIAYVVKRFGVYQIWLMNADGMEQKQIVRSGVRFTDYLPTWSPDGQLILFNQRPAKVFDFPKLMSISSTDRTVEQGSYLQLDPFSIEDVQYSPDGFYLLYEGEDNVENNDIFYMTVTGANIVRVTSDKGLDFDPAWRPLGE